MSLRQTIGCKVTEIRRVGLKTYENPIALWAVAYLQITLNLGGILNYLPSFFEIQADPREIAHPEARHAASTLGV